MDERGPVNPCPPPKSQITAVTAIYNRTVTTPTDIAAYGINLYYNTRTAQLAVALRSGNTAGDTPSNTWAASESDFRGHIIDESEMDTDYYKGVNIVVAMTKSNQANPTQNDISMISPVYKKLDTTGLAHKKVSLCSSGEDAWVYYVSLVDEQTSIMEYSIMNNSATSHNSLYTDRNSTLSAWYDPDKDTRYVIFQKSKDTKLIEYDMMDNQTENLDINDAQYPTSLAVAWYKGKVYLYYINKDQEVRRAIRNDRNSWEPSQKVPGAATVAKGSQLSVVNVGGVNHIFYLTGGSSDKFAHILDKNLGFSA